MTKIEQTEIRRLDLMKMVRDSEKRERILVKDVNIHMKNLHDKNPAIVYFWIRNVFEEGLTVGIERCWYRLDGKHRTINYACSCYDAIGKDNWREPMYSCKGRDLDRCQVFKTLFAFMKGAFYTKGKTKAEIVYE